MAQTITIWSNGVAEINTEINFVRLDGEPFTDALQAKVDVVLAVITEEGVTQIHVEKDTNREFEHRVVGTEVLTSPFGTTVSAEDFSWVMSHIEEQVALQQEEAALAAAAALAALAAAEGEAEG